MLVHLSNTSPYVCDLNRGPIEQSNRMASAPTKKATALLERKESFPKGTRTPLKLLAPDEVPMDTTATATDINASLQPIWYTEQTIVDDHHIQQEDIASIIQEQQKKGKSLRPQTTLSPIPSESPSIPEDDEELPNQPLLMHKSSTFTIEPTTTVDSPLNDSEKENTANSIIPPSDDSFRALEQLLGLGSNTTVRESPKTNHDTLSLTVVTPTDIINATTTSLRMSYAPNNGSDSLPSSQNIPTMPTIESIISTEPPSFLIDNTAMEEEQASTTMNQQNSFENEIIKDDTNTDDETNFSFELNDFPNNSKNESPVDVPPPMITIRAPTCADVAYRALIKPRTGGGRVSQPVKADSPLAKQNKLRSSAPTSRMLRSSCRRISTDSPSQEQPTSTVECFVNETSTSTEPQIELVEVVSLPEEDENEQEKTDSVTLNLSSSKVIEQNESIQSEQFSTPNKAMMPMLSREYTFNTPNHRSSKRHCSMLNSSRATPIQQTINKDESNSTSMLGILLTKPTENQPNVLQKTITVPPPVRTSTRNSPSIASKSMLGVLLTKPTEAEPSVVPSPIRTSTRRTTTNSPSIASKSMLGVLLTQPTDNEPSVAPSPVRTSTRRTTTHSPSIASKSMLGVLLTQPTEAEPNVAPSPVRTATRKTTTHSPSIASKSMLGVLLTQPTEAEPNVAPSPVRTATRKTTTHSPSIASKSMLGVLLTQPTEAEPIVAPSPVRISTRRTINEATTNSPSIASKSMLGILLTQPTEAEPSVATSPVRTSTRRTINATTTNSPAIASKSMLGILLTNPKEGEPSASSLSVQTSTRKSARSSSNATPKVSINPLHSSTPSTSRHKSLQIVSIGEQEQVSTIVPQLINNEIIQEEEQQEIEIVQLNDTEESIQQSTLIHTIETGVQTTPSLDISSRRRVNKLEQQTTPITIINEQKQITPLQTTVTMNLQRKVCFRLTPTTDARLVEKEKLEENLRGLKPDVILNPTPIILEAKQETVKPVPIKKVGKPKKRLVASKKKKTQSKRKQTVAKKSRQAQKEKPIPPTKEIKDKSEPTKRAQRKQPTPAVKRVSRKQPTPVVKRLSRNKPIQKVAAPTKRTERKPPTPKPAVRTNRTQRKEPIPEVIAPIKPAVRPNRTQRKEPIPEVIAPIKRASRKRTIPEVTTKPIEPIVKRAKTSKSVEVLPPLPPPSKPRDSSNNKQKIIPEPIKRETRTRSRSTNNKKTIPEPKNITPITKTSKRRLASVDKNEGIKKKVDEEKIQSIPLVQNLELNQEERQKIEALTVAALKSRLNTHKADVPKGAKKADLIVLLIKIETNLLQERKQTETTPARTTTMTTRLRKK